MSDAGSRQFGDATRGQLVLLAAVALALALVPLVGAYLQLGYSDDVRASERSPTAQATGTLDRSLQDAAGTTREYDWADREAAVTALRATLAPKVETLETARLADGISYRVVYNDTRADEWYRGNCPRGPDRQFGPCDSTAGVVVQDRAGTTHTLAVAVDVHVTTPNQETTVTTVLTVDSV